MKLGALFAGIGGFELAAKWAGIEPLWSNEIDSFCCKVLRKNFTHEIIEADIRTIGKQNLKSVDIIAGGFPCQPFSMAGKRKGKEDDRWLWPEMFRVISELEPRWVVIENVPGIIDLAFEQVVSEMENKGYKTETFNIPACSKNTLHRRERIWIIANFIGNGCEWNKESSGRFKQAPFCESDSQNIHLSDFEYERCQEQWETGTFRSNPIVSDTRRRIEPGVVRGVYGVPNRVDRIKALGNAIVPQIAYEIFKSIKEYEL